MKVQTTSYDIGYPLSGAVYLENDVLLVAGGSSPGPESKLTALKINFDKKKVIRRYRELALDVFDDIPTSLDAARGLILMGCNEVEERVRETGANHHLRKYTFRDEHLKPVANIDLDHVSGDVVPQAYYTRLVSIAPNASVAAVASSKLPTVIKVVDPIEFSIHYEIETTRDVLTMQFSPDSSSLAYVTAGSLDVVSIVSGQFILRKTDFGSGLTLMSCNFVDDTTILVVAKSSNELVLMKVQFSLKPGVEPVINKVQLPIKALGNVVAVNVAPNKVFAALATDANTIILIDLKSLRVIDKLKAADIGPIKQVLVSPDSRCITSISSGRAATIHVIQLPAKLKTGPGFWARLGSVIKMIFKIIVNFALVVLLAYGAQMAYERDLHLKAYDYCYDLYMTRYKDILDKYLASLTSIDFGGENGNNNDNDNDRNYFKINDHSYEVVSSTTIVQGDIVSVTSFTSLLESSSTTSVPVVNEYTKVERIRSSIIAQSSSSVQGPRVVELHPREVSVIETKPFTEIESSTPVYISISNHIIPSSDIGSSAVSSSGTSYSSSISRVSIPTLIDTPLPSLSQLTTSEPLQSEYVASSATFSHYVSPSVDSSFVTSDSSSLQATSLSTVRRQVTIDNVVYEVVATLTNLGTSEQGTTSQYSSPSSSLHPLVSKPSPLSSVHQTSFETQPVSLSSLSTPLTLESVSLVTQQTEVPITSVSHSSPSTLQVLSASASASTPMPVSSTMVLDTTLSAHTEMPSVFTTDVESSNIGNAPGDTIAETETPIQVLSAETASPIINDHSLSLTQHPSSQDHVALPNVSLVHPSILTTIPNEVVQTTSEVNSPPSFYATTKASKTEPPVQHSDVPVKPGLTTKHMEHHDNNHLFISNKIALKKTSVPFDVISSSFTLTHMQHSDTVSHMLHLPHDGVSSSLSTVADKHLEKPLTSLAVGEHPISSQIQDVSPNESMEDSSEPVEVMDSKSSYFENHPHTEHLQPSEVVHNTPTIVTNETPVASTGSMIIPKESHLDSEYSHTTSPSSTVDVDPHPEQKVFTDINHQSEKLDVNEHGMLPHNVNV